MRGETAVAMLAATVAKSADVVPSGAEESAAENRGKNSGRTRPANSDGRRRLWWWPVSKQGAGLAQGRAARHYRPSSSTPTKAIRRPHLHTPVRNCHSAKSLSPLLPLVAVVGQRQTTRKAERYCASKDHQVPPLYLPCGCSGTAKRHNRLIAVERQNEREERRPLIRSKTTRRRRRG